MLNENFVKDIIKSMSIEEKTGAMMTLGFAGVVPKNNVYEYINKYHCGGLRLSPEVRNFGSYVDPKSGKAIMDIGDFSGIKYSKRSPVCKPSYYRNVLRDLQREARNRKSGIPLHFSTDMEGGTSTDPLFNEMVYFPKPMGIRATGKPSRAYEIALAQGKQLKSMGINWIHSPVLDVNSNPNNPEIYNRSYSDKAEDVYIYAKETCRGFKDAGIITTGKHFPGRGSSHVDAHFSEPRIEADLQDLKKRDLYPYFKLFEDNVLPAVMIAHSVYDSLDPERMATFSHKIIHELLRGKMGFDGVVTSDSMTMAAIVKEYGVPEGCVMALEAGADLVLMKAETNLVGETFEAILKAIKDGRLKEEFVDQKIGRILKLKMDYGLFDEEDQAAPDPDTVICDARFSELADEVAKESLYIYKSNDLPLSADDQSVLVIEQKIKHYNLISWHSGQFYERLQTHNPYVHYLETDFVYDEADKTNIERLVDKHDTIIMTSYFLRGNRKNLDYLNELLDRFPQKCFIFVTNTPYETLSIPSKANNVLITFSMAPAAFLNAADVIFGYGEANGDWPLYGPNKG